MRVVLQRHVVAVVDFQKITRTFTIGEATVQPLPRDVANKSNVLRRPDDGYETLNYEGEVRCSSDVQVGGFGMGQLVVKVSLLHCNLRDIKGADIRASYRTSSCCNLYPRTPPNQV